MKYKFLLITILSLNFYFSQTNYVLKFKFNEKYFLSNFITHKTNNSFVLKIFKEADSISDFRNSENYVEIVDSLLKDRVDFTKKELGELTLNQKNELDSLKIVIQNGDFLKLFKSSVETNFSVEFLKKNIEKEGIKNFEIFKTSYNSFNINFSDKESVDRVKILLNNNKIFFHEEIDGRQLEDVQNCFMKENQELVDDNYLKKEDNYLLIYYENDMIKQLKIESKCFDSNNITTLIKKGGYSDVYSKLFFVKNSGDLENSISKSIKGFDLEFKKNEKSYNDNLFYLTVYLDEKGKESLKNFSEKNIGKTVFISNKSQPLLYPKIKSSLIKGSFLISGNMFIENWQETIDIIRFEVFKNSLTFQ